MTVSKTPLARNDLSAGARGSPFVHQSSDIAPELLQVAINLKSARDDRTSYFEPGMFGEAGWDMLLALYIAHGRGYTLKVSDACYEAAVAPTTALRWLDSIEQAGLAERRSNMLDRRSILVSITPQGIARLNEYLASAQHTLSRT
jgi:DNA-binding MarR family transcriptional regulator